MPAHPEPHPLLHAVSLLTQRYFDHHVGRDSAALTYYLLFALFPLLIFVNNVVGLLPIDIDALLDELSRIVPRDVVELFGQYLRYVSRVSSKSLLWFSLVFTVWFPFRAVSALFLSVRKAYGEGPPARFIPYQLRILLYTLLLLVVVPVSVVSTVVGRSVLEFVSNFIYLNDTAIRLWTQLRFLFLAALLFFSIAALYPLALDRRAKQGSVMPGVLASLTAWTVLSIFFSLYVEHSSNYSVIYGSIGGIIVLLLWLYLVSTMLIMGAEFNSVRLELEKTDIFQEKAL